MARRRKNWDGYSRGFTTRRRASLKKAQMVANRNRKRKASYGSAKRTSYQLNPTRHSKQYNGYLKAQAKQKSAKSAARRAKAGRNVKIAAVIGAGALAGYGAHIAAQKGKAGVRHVNNAERAMRVTAIRKANASAPVAAKRAVATTTAKAKQATVPKTPTTVAKPKPSTRAPKVASATKAAPRKVAEPTKKPIAAPQNSGVKVAEAAPKKATAAPRKAATAEVKKTTATTVKQAPPAPTAPATKVSQPPKSYAGAKVQTPGISAEGKRDAKKAGMSEKELMALAGRTGKVKRSAVAPGEVTFDRTVTNVGIGKKKSGAGRFQMSGVKLKSISPLGSKSDVNEFGPGQKELLTDSLAESHKEYRETLKLLRSSRNKY